MTLANLGVHQEPKLLKHGTKRWGCRRGSAAASTSKSPYGPNTELRRPTADRKPTAHQKRKRGPRTPTARRNANGNYANRRHAKTQTGTTQTRLDAVCALMRCVRITCLSISISDSDESACPSRGDSSVLANSWGVDGNQIRQACTVCRVQGGIYSRCRPCR